MGRCQKTSPENKSRLGEPEQLHAQYILSRPDTDRYQPDALGEYVPAYGTGVVQPAWRRDNTRLRIINVTEQRLTRYNLLHARRLRSARIGNATAADRPGG